ncbi:MAG: hypothetical protein ACQEQL_02105 [Pseudomonadota bacterium]
MSEPISNSRYTMWRAIIALAHADHVVTQEEKDFIMKKLESLPFSTEQRTQLLEDMEESPDIEALLPDITEPVDRSMLVYYGRLLVWSDGEYALQEEKLLKLMNMNALTQVDLDKALSESKDYARQYADRYEQSLKEEERGDHGPFLTAFDWINDFINKIRG